MARGVTRLWYRIALERPDRTRVLVAAEGAHLGEAIAAAEHHRKGARAFAAEVCSDADIPLGESVGKERVVELGPLATAAYPARASARWPAGVLPQLGGGAEIGEVRRGFAVRGNPGAADDPSFILEAQTDAEHLVDLFLGMVERLPAADNLEIQLLDHFEDAGTTDIWLTSRTTAKSVIRFLDDHENDFLENGHVQISVYLRAQRATLRLTEHKSVVWLAEDRVLEPDVVRWLGELAVPRTDSLVTLAAAPHFHYRPAGTRDRKKLGEILTRQRLRRVDVVRAPDGRLTAG